MSPTPDASSTIAAEAQSLRPDSPPPLTRLATRLLFWLTRNYGPLLVAMALCIAGIKLCQFKYEACADVVHVGHSDEVAYIQMGRSLASGRWFDVNYISTFFIPYPRSITHREDHWPPFLAFIHAIVFELVGITPRTTRIAPIIVGTLLLPLVTAGLATALSRRAYVGLLAGVFVLAQPDIFGESVAGLSDLSMAMLVTGFLWAAIAAARHPWMHIVAGLFAGLAYYAKGSQLVLLAGYPLLAILVCGLPVLRRKWLWIGMTLGAIIIAPWMISNARLYGNPLHSTQNYVSGYIGLHDWERETYRIYWNLPLPKTSDRWTKDPARYASLVSSNREEFARQAFFGPSARSTAWRDIGPVPESFAEFLRQTPPRPEPPHKARTHSSNGHSPTPPAMLPPNRWTDPELAISSLLTVSFFGVLAVATPPILFILLVAWIIRWERRFRGTAMVAQPNPAQKKWSQWRPYATALGFLLSIALLITIYYSIGPDMHWLMLGIALSIAWIAGELLSVLRLGERWLLFPLLAIFCILLMEWSFIVYFWQVISRFAFVFVPPFAAIACTAASRVIELPLLIAAPRALKRWNSLAVIVLLCSGLVIVDSHENAWAKYYTTHALNPHLSRYVKHHEYSDAADWIAQNFPDAVVMCRNPWELGFYLPASAKTVEIPVGSAKEIFDMARYYHVTHYLDDTEPGTQRPALWEYENGAKPGFKPVRPKPQSHLPAWRLFELQYDKLPQ